MEYKKDGFANQRAIILLQLIKNILQKNPITNLLYITDIGFYPEALGHYRMRKEGTPQHILIYCTKGNGWLSINGKRYTICKNDFFIIEANVPHSYGATENEPWSIYWIHFTGEKSDLFKSIYNKIYHIDNAPEARFKDRLLLFEDIYQNLEQGYSMENLEYTSLCLWHFIASFRFISQFRKVNKTSNNIIQNTIQFMKNNINNRITLDEMAENVHYSPSRFGQLFFKQTGNSPLNYFMQLKIQKACQLLDFSDMKIKEIANELNFYDQYHFSKMFTKLIGETPSSYRKKRKG